MSYYGGIGHDVVFVQGGVSTAIYKFERDVQHKEIEGHTGPVLAICSVLCLLAAAPVVLTAAAFRRRCSLLVVVTSLMRSRSRRS